MIVLKLYYHLICLVKTLFYKLIYNKSFTMPFSSTYRTGFHVVIEETGGVKIGDIVSLTTIARLLHVSALP